MTRHFLDTYANEGLNVAHVSGGASLLHAVGVVTEPEDEDKLDSHRVIESVGLSHQTVANHIVREGIGHSSDTTSTRGVQLEGLGLSTGGSSVGNDQPLRSEETTHKRG